MMPTVHGQHRPELLFPPPQQQQQSTPPDHPVAITGYPPAHRSHSQPNTPFDTYMGSGPPVAMSSTPQPPGQVQFQQRRFPHTSQIDNSPSMPPPPPPQPQPPRRPVTTVPGGGGPYQQQQFSQPYPPGAQMGPGSSHSQQEFPDPVQQLQQARLQHQRQLRQQQQQHQYQQQQRQQQQQQYNYATTNGLPRKRPHSTQTPPMYRPPPAKRASPAVAPPGTINPSDLQQALGPAPAPMPPGPARPASNPPPPVPQQFQQPLQPPRNTMDLTSVSSTTSSLTGQPRPQVRSTPPFVQHSQGGVMQQQAPQQRGQQQQQQQHPAEYQRQQAEYHKRLQYQQQQQRQLRSSNNVNSGGGGSQLHGPQQPQPQSQQQLNLSFDADDYAREELAKHTADLTAQFLPTQTWFPELENQYFPSYMVPTWTDLYEPGPNGPKLPLESYTETDPVSQQQIRKPALVEDWLLDKTGAPTIPAFYVPCEFCTWLRIKTGQGGHCFPSFAVRDATGEDCAPGQGGRRVTLHTDKHVVRPRCTTCVGFGIETCTVGDNININDDPQINVEREAEYMRNTAVRDILPKPLQGEAEEGAVTGATDVEML
ncbi:hypothetical protein PG991_008054 [Apiospora marii]|uniref:Uncharacterized protein n=1 Tax=Apiospora marii TaxID=335849 RepID=A0ABR1RV69_9PEZI